MMAYYSQLADYFTHHLLDSHRPGADILFKRSGQ